MAAWWYNSDWIAFTPVDLGEATAVDCAEASAAIFDTSDALSAPAVEGILPAGLALLPRGAAWGSPDGEAVSSASNWAGLVRALLAPFADLYAKGFGLTNESRAATLVYSLEAWERDYGLPDPCSDGDLDEDRRRANLAARVAGLATITPADIVCLAARLGYVVAVEEPEAFRCGESDCGYSGELSNVALEQQITVHIKDAPSTNFEVGISETGVDRLLDFDIGTIECAIRRVLPAWVYVYFSIDPLPEAYLLADESGALIVTETGAAILMPVYL